MQDFVVHDESVIEELKGHYRAILSLLGEDPQLIASIADELQQEPQDS